MTIDQPHWLEALSPEEEAATFNWAQAHIKSKGVRCWLEQVVKDAGGDVTRIGTGDGDADLVFAIDGCTCLVTIVCRSD
jgi:hypothetical protein